MNQPINPVKTQNKSDSFRDIPTSDLIPLHNRKITERVERRLSASIQGQGLIEPLVVYKEDNRYIILDGHLRYKILTRLGIPVVPCIIHNQKESFTPNRMVNHLSPVQENRMIEKALTELDEKTIATALGLNQLGFRQKKNLLEKLHFEIVELLDKGVISQRLAKDLSYVTKPRQEEIVKAMREHDDFSLTFIRTLILKTRNTQRVYRKNITQTPWNRSAPKKKGLLEKLKETEKKCDFYSQLYRNYSIDIMKLIVYVRSLITNKIIHEYLKEHHFEILQQYMEIVFEDRRGNNHQARAG